MTGKLPLSHAQREVWDVRQAQTDHPTFNMALYLHVRGRVERDLLQESLRPAIGESTRPSISRWARTFIRWPRGRGSPRRCQSSSARPLDGKIHEESFARGGRDR